MIRTYKYRLRPTKKQAYLLGGLFFQMQTVYNDALNERRWAWSRSRQSVSYYDQWKRLRDERHALPDEMGMINATSMQQMLRRVDKAYQAFYKGLRGHPRFKNSKRFKSVEFRYGDGCKLRDDRLYVQNVGQIKVRLHRDIPDDAKIKHVIIKRLLDKWYVCLMLELPDVKQYPNGRQDVGIDVGLTSLLALSDGTLIDNPRWLRSQLRKLRVAQRRVSRRKQGGANWRRAVKQVAKLHEKIANTRRDFWHKTTRLIVDTYGNIALEDLNLLFVTSNSHLSLSAQDAALGEFRRMLEYKAEEAGTQVVAVNPANTSQICSGCGQIVRKSLHVRTHHCSCGLSLDRDVNAARNILALGRSAWALTCPVGESVAQEAPSFKRGEWVTHPGEILLEEFMKPLGLSQYRLAKDIGVTPIRISQIVNGKRSITVDTAMRLARYFGTSAAVWLRLQVRYDLEVAEMEISEQIKREVKVLQQPTPNP
jgi:putative transposase